MEFIFSSPLLPFLQIMASFKTNKKLIVKNTNRNAFETFRNGFNFFLKDLKNREINK